MFLASSTNPLLMLWFNQVAYLPSLPESLRSNFRLLLLRLL